MVDDANEDAIQRDEDQLAKDKAAAEKKASEPTYKATTVQPDPRKSDVAPAGVPQSMSQAKANQVAVPAAVSHPSVAAIVPAVPGGPAGPDKDNLIIHARPFTGEAPQVVHMARQHDVLPPIPPIPVAPGDVVKTSAQEQLERSEANERAGLQNWAMNNDDRRRPGYQTTNIPGGVVPGVKSSA